MKHYFLGAAAGYTRAKRLQHTFAVGRERDRVELVTFLEERYKGEATLCKNGRSALALALKAYFKRGDAIIVNSFTCYAVYEAIKAAGLIPVWADISRESLNFDLDKLRALEVFRPGHAQERSPKLMVPNETSPSADRLNVRGIIVQNTFGNPVDIVAVEKFAKQHNLTIIEDLAHCTGMRYADGREAGTVGAACALSFGKDKVIDTVSGGAVILRNPEKRSIKAPNKTPRFSDHLRARFYPLFGAIYRGLSYVHLHGAWMRCLLALRLVERSADNKLDLSRKISKFEAKLALRQLKNLRESGEKPLREFHLVHDRGEVLRELAKAGYYFGGFWYEKPVSPERYYKKTHFPEAECPNAVYVAEHIVNLPNYYDRGKLATARKIIRKYKEKDE